MFVFIILLWWNLLTFNKAFQKKAKISHFYGKR